MSAEDHVRFIPVSWSMEAHGTQRHKDDIKITQEHNGSTPCFVRIQLYHMSELPTFQELP